MKNEHGVRYRRDTGWELRCASCRKSRHTPFYWPLTHEFWDTHRGLTRCKACWRNYDLHNKRERYRTDPVFRAEQLEKNRARRLTTREVARIKHTLWRQNVAATDPDRYQAMLERQREATARWRAKKKSETVTSL